MSRKYKFLNKEGLYFVSFATVNWIDARLQVRAGSVRPQYNNTILESLKYCRANLGMELLCWCIMPSHVHLIYRAKENNPEIILGRFKEPTCKQVIKAINSNLQESRRNLQ
ncbi:hypothetical protein WG906_14010 [Pedobacter sp. P351]|uniref:hypothetical protein n=1 Tax=Pedobacter superstes TaxID=3133441 RepID=UPI0030ADF942